MHPSSWSRFINSSYTLPPVKLSNCRHGVLFEKYWLSIASKFGRHNMIPESFHNFFVSLFKYCSYTIILTLQGSRQRWGQSGLRYLRYYWPLHFNDLGGGSVLPASITVVVGKIMLTYFIKSLLSRMCLSSQVFLARSVRSGYGILNFMIKLMLNV